MSTPLPPPPPVLWLGVRTAPPIILGMHTAPMKLDGDDDYDDDDGDDGNDYDGDDGNDYDGNDYNGGQELILI